MIARTAVLVLAFAASQVFAGPAAADGGLPLPRFVALRAGEVNLRTGPGERYPIEWVLTRKDMPVEVLAEYEHWRKVRDWDGTVGWVHQRMVSGKQRFVLVERGAPRELRVRPAPDAPVEARAEPGVVAKLLECDPAWCRVEAGGHAGWLRRADLWGVYPTETIR